jgi:hypothetical protein
MIDIIQQLPPTQIFKAAVRQFRADVLRGLRAPKKELPCKYFYDEVGSALFEQITELEEYYPTRTELGIMERHAAEMAELLGPRCLLIEYGSGSSLKTRRLLDQLRDPAGYVPIDVSGVYLRRSARALGESTRISRCCRCVPTSRCRWACPRAGSLHPDGWSTSPARRSATSRRRQRSPCCDRRRGCVVAAADSCSASICGRIRA